MKVDVCMWTKNSATTLPLVLKRISDVIPAEFVEKRIISDDHSEDNTVEVAKSLPQEDLLKLNLKVRWKHKCLS